MAYNGWSNYETWNVALWLGEMDMESDIEDMGSQFASAYELAKYLQDFVDDLNLIAGDASLFADLLNAALREVDWNEIAEHYWADMEHDSEETEDELA